MDADSVRRIKLIKQIKHGRQTGATQWVRLFVVVGASVEMLRISEVVLRQGKGSFAILTTAIGMVLLVTIAAIGLVQLEMNERFAALLELIGGKK